MLMERLSAAESDQDILKLDPLLTNLEKTFGHTRNIIPPLFRASHIYHKLSFKSYIQDRLIKCF